jgi:hypothetical protein
MVSTLDHVWKDINIENDANEFDGNDGNDDDKEEEEARFEFLENENDNMQDILMEDIVTGNLSEWLNETFDDIDVDLL